jgi:hypothetical protein
VAAATAWLRRPDADAAAVAEHAQGEAEGGGALALAGAGHDDEEAFLRGLGGDLGVLDGLAVGHLALVAEGFGVVGHRRGPADSAL